MSSLKWIWDLCFIFVFLIIVGLILYIIGSYRAPYVPPSNCKYNDIKHVFKTGDVLLFKNSNIMAKIACSVDPSPFLHMALVVIGPDGRIMLCETDNSKAIRRDGVFMVDFESKMYNYPGSDFCLLQFEGAPDITFETCLNLFKKYDPKYTFQKKPWGWLSLAIKQDWYNKLIGESNSLLCIEMVSLMLRDLNIIKSDTNIHQISPSNYFNQTIPLNDGIKIKPPIYFKY